jgi:hypothetical protein
VKDLYIASLRTVTIALVLAISIMAVVRNFHLSIA